MQINNRQYTPQDIIRRNADRGTLYGCTRYQISGGKAGGLNMIGVHNAAKLRLELCADRALDIASLSYGGVNIGYQSKNGLVNPIYTNSFHDYMTGGMLFTCGLSTSGAGGDYQGEWQPFHGKMSTIPADLVNTYVSDNAITVSGTMQESTLFGRRLTLRREITVPLDRPAVIIRDTITNNTTRDEYYFMLYHFNFGFPFLSENLVASFPTDRVDARTPYSIANIDSHTVMSAPMDNVEETVYFHTFSSEPPARATVELVNPELALRASLTYETANLPMLGEWKSMGSTDYALGIEPSSSSLKGRKGEIESGYDRILHPFESVSFGVELAFEELNK